MSFVNSKLLTLKNLFRVPSISKNLISMSKFARDNNVFFEFFPDVCFVKDQVSKAVLMKGILKDGLYAFDHLSMSFNQPQLKSASVQCSSSVVNTLTRYNKTCNFGIWHNRLGRPSSYVVSNVLKACNLPFDNKSVHSFYDACCLGKIHKFPFDDSSTFYTEPLQLVHTDLLGTAPHLVLIHIIFTL